MLIKSPSDLAGYFRDQRKQHHVSQSTIAEETALRQDTISKFELKPDNVRLDTLFRLLASLELELHIAPKDKASIVSEKQTGWTEQW